jgi:hypothetical protein
VAQPTLIQLFGTGTTISSGNLVVPLSALASVGLSDQDPLGIFGAIIKIGGDWIAANTDESVMASCEKSTFAPITRNNLEKTQYNYNLAFYGSYQAPTFDPDDL